MAVVVSEGTLLSTNRETLRPSINGSRGAIELYSGTISDYAAIYRTQPNVRLVVRFLGRNIAQLGLKAYRRKSRTEREELEPTSELARTLKSPAPALPKPPTRHRFIRGLVEDLAIFDVAYIVKMRNEGSGRLNLVRIPPQNMRPDGDSWLWPEKFILSGNRGQKELAPESVIYIHGHNPDDPRTGLSPLEALRRTLAEEAAAGEWREQHWKNAARHSGVIERPSDAPKWSDPARVRFTEDWRANWTGNGPEAGGTPVLEEGMKFIAAGFSARDSEYLGSRRLSREEVAAAYFIPPSFVGILENANFSNMKEQHVSLYSDTLGPWLDLLTEDLELQLLPDFENVENVYLEFNLDEKLRGSFEEQATAAQASVGAPWITRNEQRARFNLAPIPGGDALVVPLNVLVGGQASPLDSAPDPGALALPPPVVKALPPGPAKALPTYLEGWQAKHVEVLTGFFGRQKSSVLSKLGAGQDLDAAFERSRWDAELRDDLLALSASMAADVGGEVSSDFGATFDPDVALPWLTENARIAAEGINGATFDDLALAWSGVARRGEASKALDDALAEVGLDLADNLLEDTLAGSSFLDPARNVFALALAVRVFEIATTRSTSIGQWSRREAASQAGARTKTWHTNSANSRHAALNGQTVPLGQAFSNGAHYPGDPTLGVDQVAGCLCSLSFGID